MTDATAGPGAVIVRTGLSGRYTLIGTSSGDVTGFRCMVVIDVEVWAGASAGCTSGSLVAADCAMICRDRDVSSDDTIETVYVRNSGNRLQTKLILYSRHDVIFTVVSVADVDRRLICLSNPRTLSWAAKVYICQVW